MKISIDGNIGCGKTSVMKRLNDELRIPIFLEPLQRWHEFLTLFYQDPNKWALPFNLEVLNSFHDWKQNQFPALYERSPLSCRHVFAQLNHESNHIHALEMKVFDKIYKELGWYPDVIIYIQTDPTTAMARMQKRARECESQVSLDYIQKVHDKYQDLFKSSNGKYTASTTIHIIDGNQDAHKVFEDVKKLVLYYTETNQV